MDIGITIEYLISLVKYEGSVSDNLKSSYDAIRWLDDIPKPTWEELQNAWILLEQQIANKKRIAELKQLLAESDWTQLPDVVTRKGQAYVDGWATQRLAWWNELQGLEPPNA